MSYQRLIIVRAIHLANLLILKLPTDAFLDLYRNPESINDNLDLAISSTSSRDSIPELIPMDSCHVKLGALQKPDLEQSFVICRTLGLGTSYPASTSRAHPELISEIIPLLQVRLSIPFVVQTLTHLVTPRVFCPRLDLSLLTCLCSITSSGTPPSTFA